MTESAMPYEVEDMQPTEADMTESDRLLLKNGPTKVMCGLLCPFLRWYTSLQGDTTNASVVCTIAWRGKESLFIGPEAEAVRKYGGFTYRPLQSHDSTTPCCQPTERVLLHLERKAEFIGGRIAMVKQADTEARRYEELRKEAGTWPSM